jgi:hypothetical protein
MENTIKFRQRLCIQKATDLDMAQVAMSKEIAATLILLYMRGQDITKAVQVVTRSTVAS